MESPDPAAALVGSWQLVSWTMEQDGRGTVHPYGSSPTGLLTYSTDGRVQVNIAAGEHAAAPGDARPVDLRRTYFAYGGRYHVTERHGIVHDIELSMMAELQGSAQLRRVELTASELILSAEVPVPRTGRTGRHRIRWHRAVTGGP